MEYQEPKYPYVQAVLKNYFCLASQDSPFYKLLDEFYEAEYKYSLAKNTNYKLANLYGITLRDLGIQISRDLSPVYEDWLEQHAILEPHKWAERRFHDDAEMEMGDDYLITTFLHNAKFETGIPLERQITPQTLEDFPELTKWLQFLVDDMNSTKEEGDEEYTPDSALDLFASEAKSSLESLAHYNRVLFKKVMIEFYEKILFPACFDKWQSEGIEGTRNRVEETYKLLQEIKKQKPDQIIVTVNRALQESHQTGEMMDYIEPRLDVDTNDLDELSKKDSEKLKDLEEEVQEMQIAPEL